MGQGQIANAPVSGVSLPDSDKYSNYFEECSLDNAVFSMETDCPYKLRKRAGAHQVHPGPIEFCDNVNPRKSVKFGAECFDNEKVPHINCPGRAVCCLPVN